MWSHAPVQGGDTVCVTRGVVSRVTILAYEEQKYQLVMPELLAIQVHSAPSSRRVESLLRPHLPHPVTPSPPPATPIHFPTSIPLSHE